MKFQVLRRGCVAALVAAAPLGGAAAQQTDQRGIGQQQQQEQPQGQPPTPQGQPRPLHPNPPPPAPVQHVAPPAAPTPPGQHPAQNAPPPNPGPQNASPQSAGPQNPGPPGRGAQFQQRFTGAPPAPATQAAPQQPGGPPRGNPQPDRGRGDPRNFAEHHSGAAPEQFDRGRFYGHDFDHFTPREREIWHEGRWRHEFHDGRYGWWYDVDDVWYFYPEPIYPYPTYVPEIVYLPEVEQFDEAPPPVAVAPAPPSNYYYYCDDAQAYYPYVTSCDMPWRPVPATPPQ